ncbi:hypothetical protein SLS62_002585 [Diatrype stigma]|uniref:Velvet domain-containing protein n=1 Tax=Diatrype stigma TaxID=117547 RepID=A0AAN9YV04_9PEZI
MITIAVQPPSQVQVGRVIYPPLVISSGADAGYDFVQVSLLDPYGRVMESQLEGTLAKNKQPIGDSQAAASRTALEYAVFPDLSLSYSGTYTLQVTAFRMDYSDPGNVMAVVVTSETTNAINAYDQPVAFENPCKLSKAK